MNGLRSTLLVAGREARERARSRAFLASTAITILLLAAVVGVVALTDDGPSHYEVALVGDTPASLHQALQATAVKTGVLLDVASLTDAAAAAAAVDDGGIEAAIVGDDTILLGEDTSDQLADILEVGLRQSLVLSELEAAGLDTATIVALLGAGGDISIVRTGGDAEPSNEGIAFASIVLLFIVITTYGQWVLMGVLEEKTTRVVELVVSSTSVRSLLAGKVLGIGLLGMGHMLLIIALALATGSVFDFFEIPTGTASAVVWSLVWFLLGFAFYAVLYAAAGSLVSRSEDAQAAAMPIALVGIAAYLVTFVVIMPDPDSTAALTLSLLPPVAPIAFPARIAFTGVPVWQILTGVAITTLTLVVVVRLAARVYAGALLTAGGRIKIRDAWRAAGELAVGRG